MILSKTIGMRTFNVLLILSIFLSGLSAQLLTCKKVSASLDKTILLHETGPLEETYIFIKKNSGKTIDSLKLPAPIDGYCFNAYHPGEREFAVITDRFKFWILNLLNNECAGPFECIPRHESVDAQSGILDSFKISENGQYLFFTAVITGHLFLA